MKPHEDFIGFYAIPVANSDTLVEVIRDTLVRMNLSLANCRRQCYDGAAVMKGVRNGVSTQILSEQPKALYTHCYGHSLNLACQDMVREVKRVKEALDTTFELSKLLKYSAKRVAEYKRLKQEIAPEEPGFRTLCPTRWTVRAASLQSILSNYSVLQDSLANFADMAKNDHEMSAKCMGVGAQFSSFNFLFGVALGQLVLELADNLSKSLQQKSLSAAEGQHLAEETIRTLQDLRTDKQFDTFWTQLIAKQRSLDVDEPQLPRHRKVPARLQEGNASPVFPTTLTDHFRPIFFEAVDTIVLSIKERFNQQGYQQYRQLEGVLLKGVNGVSCVEEKAAVQDLYGDKINMSTLDAQIHLLRTHFSPAKVTVAEIVSYVNSLEAKNTYMSQVIILLRLILVAPATNATSERSYKV